MSATPRIFPRWVIALAVIISVGLLFWALRGVLTPVFFAFLIAYMLDPVVDRLERRGLPRAAAIVVLLTAVLGALAVFALLAVPLVVRDVGRFVAELPSALAQLLQRLEPQLAALGIEVPHTLDEAFTQFDLDGPALADKAVGPATAVLTWLLGGTMTILGLLANAVIVPVFAFYLLYDFDRMIAACRELIPVHWRPFVVDVVSEVDLVLGEFVRGQLIVMLLLAVLYAVAYAIVGVRLAIVIGVVAGLLSFIPYVGGAMALGLALLMCVLDWTGPMKVVWVGVAYGVIQVLEGFVITPRVVGEKVGLSPIWVLFALMVGSELFGFLGVLLALPAAAVAKIFAVRGVAWYRESEFFRTASPTSGNPGGLGALLRQQGLPDESGVAARKAAATDDDPTTHPDGL
jgi:predicted PurR-regulated permease PerM